MFIHITFPNIPLTFVVIYPENEANSALKQFQNHGAFINQASKICA